jgi:16S rRNA (adenine1518-N6/adenine1519-N6)-dimethyltransferase
MVQRPRKRFGQNFLRDQAVIERIISAIRPRPHEHIVEIGPGRGAITRPLLTRCGRLDLIELDRDLAAELTTLETDTHVDTSAHHASEPRSPSNGRQSDTHIQVHQADALRFDFGALVKDRKVRIVGNLPYNISTPLLFHLLNHADSFEDLHLMLQKEVGIRMAASPGGKDYGRLSVMLQAKCHVKILFRVPPAAFNPVPKVDSSFLRIIPRTNDLPKIVNPPLFKVIVTRAFSQRRKTLRNGLLGVIASDDIERSGIDPQRRPQTLSVAEFVTLANAAASP